MKKYKQKLNNDGIKKFYYFENKQVKIDKYELLKFYEDNGFYKMSYLGQSKDLIRIENNIVKRISRGEIVSFTREYLEKNNEIDVLKYFLGNNVITNSFIENIKSKEVNFLTDSSDCSFIFFKNLAVRVTKDKIEYKSYCDFKKCVWESEIINHNIDLDGDTMTEYKIFLKHLADHEDERYKSLISNIGYMLHRYKDKANPRSLILLDDNRDIDTANGGTGKSLVGYSITTMRKTLKVDGKTIKTNSQFKFQEVDIDTHIIYYDDIKKDFNFEDLYSAITDGITIEKKFQTSYTLPFEQSPKIMLSSNYVLKGSHNYSDKRRKVEYEVSDFYLKNPSPMDEFGKRFFDDWDESEWNQFYLFMVENLQLYLANGLLMPESLNIQERTIKSETNEYFYEFATKNLKRGKYPQKELLNKFNKEYNEHVSPHMFTKWIKKYGVIAGMKIQVKPSNSTNLVFVYE